MSDKVRAILAEERARWLEFHAKATTPAERALALIELEAVAQGFEALQASRECYCGLCMNRESPECLRDTGDPADEHPLEWGMR